MTGRYRNLIVILLSCLSVLPAALRAQGYQIADRLPYHAASVYYVTLKNAGGESVNHLYNTTDGAIGAFVGNQLRGTSQWLTTTPGQGVFVVRVWGDEADQGTVQFHLRDHNGLEYLIGTQPFSQGEEGTYGAPSVPVGLTIEPITGISLPFAETTLKQGENRSAQPTLLPASHSTLLTTMSYTYSSDNAAFTVSDNGMITAVTIGKGTLTVKATPGNFTAQATVNVEAGIQYVPVTEIKNNMDSNAIEMREGDRLTLDFTVLPANATNKAVGFKNDYSIVDLLQDTETSPVTIIAKKAGKDTLTIISADNGQATLTYYITVREMIVPDVTLGFASQELTASKLRNTTLTLTCPSNAQVIPSRVELVFSKAPNGEPAATATKADDTGLKWTVRGQYVGKHTVKIKYNNKEQTANCTLNIPGEITFRNGWDWISLYTATTYALTGNDGNYLTSLSTNDQNRVKEIRSQKATVFYDPTLGYFGDLKHLTAADGTYKVNSTYEAANEAAKVFNIGTTPGGNDLAAMMPQVEKGYTWIGYPHERNHSLRTLQQRLAATASEGDLIIGRDAFLEFDGVTWQGSLKTFEAGKGYIYYTESEKPFRLDWGDYYMASEDNNLAAARAAEPTTEVPWHYDALKYASSMPVVARLADTSQTTGMVAGAFAGGECRGYAVADQGGWLFLSVTGNPGEHISFVLFNAASGLTCDAGHAVTFGTPKGSLRSPLLLSGNATGIGTARAEDLSMTFDGTYIRVGGTSMQQPLTVSVYDMNGRNVLTTSGHATVSLEHAAKGIYTVRATCGRSARTIKIAK